jgi:small-conductance mechanosensitive channel
MAHSVVRTWIAAAALLSAGAAGAVAPPAAAGQEAAARAGAETPAAASPQPIPLEHVFRAADELEAPLRRAEAVARVDPAVEDVEQRLGPSAAAIEHLRSELDPLRLGDASAREIERLRQAVAREDLQLAGAQSVLERRSDALAGATREIQGRLASWKLTAEAADREQAPPAVLRRVAQAAETLRVEEERLRGRRDRLLELQARVSDLRGELGRLAVHVDEAEAALERQLFEVESAPLWRAMAGADPAASLGGQLRQALREIGRDVAAFAAEEQGRLWLHLAIVLALGLGLVALRRPVAALGADDPPLRSAAQVLSTPWSAAVLLSLPLAGGLYPLVPPTLRDLLYLGLLAPLLRILPRLLPGAARRPLHALAALFALDKLASVAPPRTLLARIAVLLVTVGALSALLRGLRRGGWTRAVPSGAWAVAAKAVAAAALALLSVSVVSNVVGNATLAERLTHATLASATLAAVLLGVVTVLRGAIAALLHLPVLRRRPLVARHGALLRQRTFSLLRLGAVALWAVRTAAELGVAAAAADAASAVLGLRLHVGELDVSLGNVVAFVVTLGLALVLSRAIRFVLDEGVFTEVQLPRGIPAAVSTTVQYVLVLLGFSWAVLASGMETSRFSFLVGALGVGIGFGLQNVVNNFVSGLILLYERPVQVRDIVEVGAVSGEVTRIGVRSSTVRTFAGAEVIVPNATLISTEVTNWTLTDNRRRIELAVGVAYGTPPQQVIDLLLAAVRGRAGVLEAPAPVALFLKLGESSLDFVLRFWTAEFDRWPAIASDVMVEVHASLGRAGIQIPFPQRDLHVRSLDPAAAEALARARAGRIDLDGARNVVAPRPPDRER